jgi:hypothetical protein
MAGQDDLGALLAEVLDGRMEARMWVWSVIFWASSSGKLRSARMNTFFPLRSAYPRVPTLLLVAIPAPKTNTIK